MTNFEYYAEDIKAVGYYFAMNEDGEIVRCHSIDCLNCKLKGNCFTNRRTT